MSTRCGVAMRINLVLGNCTTFNYNCPSFSATCCVGSPVLHSSSVVVFLSSLSFVPLLGVNLFLSPLYLIPFLTSPFSSLRSSLSALSSSVSFPSFSFPSGPPPIAHVLSVYCFLVFSRPFLTISSFCSCCFLSLSFLFFFLLLPS